MYEYTREKPKLFTDAGQRKFIAIRNRARRLLKEAGAFAMIHAWKNVTGSTSDMTACVDRLVELGEIREITGPDVAGQDRVFVAVEGNA